MVFCLAFSLEQSLESSKCSISSISVFSAQKLQVTLLCSDKCSGSVGPPLLNYSHQKTSFKPNLKVPRFVLIFLQNASNQQAALKTWNFHENQVSLSRRNNIFCQQRCCRKYNRRTHRHSRIRTKMSRKRGNTFKYFCPGLLKLLNRICVFLIDTLQQQSRRASPLHAACARELS